ncbi:hypothetical protein OB2597_01432 [Pseudooceanicola batsensis HTCC2597]|uniref:YibQ protein n=1 Tax=Pseudooceanicola batsensis (strain ATCC BAA-863 / DSM 15984 / KCTC 12145 / HTCC2597) TaxID=252305 RepID=A3U2X9_PSEBH|nr:divergent polysaccharide deacetylase family protein [Pseudooceanicola batsensis]EAQ01509.1 hypothetical protein OB2597_01432 [Pseudooceanicola batsensis HTCC2597]
MLRGTILGGLWGLALAAGVAGVVSLSVPVPGDAPPETATPDVPATSAFGDARDDMPALRPAPISKPDRGDAVRPEPPEGDDLALAGEALQSVEPPALTAPDAGLGDAPAPAPGDSLPTPAEADPVLPSPLAMPPAAPAAESEPEASRATPQPPRADPGEEVTGFPSGDLDDAAITPETPVTDLPMPQPDPVAPERLSGTAPAGTGPTSEAPGPDPAAPADPVAEPVAPADPAAPEAPQIAARDGASRPVPQSPEAAPNRVTERVTERTSSGPGRVGATGGADALPPAPTIQSESAADAPPEAATGAVPTGEAPDETTSGTSTGDGSDAPATAPVVLSGETSPEPPVSPAGAEAEEPAPERPAPGPVAGVEEPASGEPASPPVAEAGDAARDAPASATIAEWRESAPDAPAPASDASSGAPVPPAAGTAPASEAGDAPLAAPSVQGTDSQEAADEDPSATVAGLAPDAPASATQTDEAAPRPSAPVTEDPVTEDPVTEDPGLAQRAARTAPDSGAVDPRPAMPGEPALRLVETAPVVPLSDPDAAPDASAGAAPEAVGPPIDRFAQPFDNPADMPLVSIVLIDDGRGDASLPADFPYPLSIAIPVTRPDAPEAMRRYREGGYEVLALAGVPAGATPADLEAAAGDWFTRLDQVVGVIETPGRGLQSGRAMGERLAAILEESGHGLLLFPEGLDTARKLATRRGVPAATVFRDLDSEGQSATVIRRFLDNSAFKAGIEGQVILVARLRPETIEALLVWGLADRAGRVALAPVSHALKAAAP